MTYKKENSGGKKFQSRQTGEKRVRSSRPKPTRNNPDARNTKFTKTEGGDKPNYGDKKPYGRKPAGEGFGNDRPPYRRGEDKPNFGDKKPYGRKAAGDGYGNDRAPFRRGEDKPKFEKDTRGELKKRFDEKSESTKITGRKNQDENRSSNYKGRGRAFTKASESLEKGKKLVEGEVRLNRYIANSGMGSRREADVMIEQGLVMVNGAVVTELGTKVKPGDAVKVDGRKINPEKSIYILLNKPKGYITTTDDPEGRKTVMELIDLPGSERIYPVGRLDRNTTGVLLLTNDGELTQKLMHPSFEIKKIYRVKLDRKPNKEHMLALVSGVELEDGFQDFKQCGFVDDKDETMLGVEIYSGRNRIVRRMFEHFGYDVVGLDRVMIGEFDHVKLGRGKWRLLTDKEIDYIEKLKRMKPKKP